MSITCDLFYLQLEPLTDAELARIASKISSMTMRNLAVQRLGLSQDQVDTMVDECRENKQSLNRQILVKWRNMNAKDSRQVTASEKKTKTRTKGQFTPSESVCVFCLFQCRKRLHSSLVSMCDANARCKQAFNAHLTFL